jgi:hypothetical protein
VNHDPDVVLSSRKNEEKDNLPKTLHNMASRYCTHLKLKDHEGSRREKTRAAVGRKTTMVIGSRLCCSHYFRFRISKQFRHHVVLVCFCNKNISSLHTVR